MLLCSHTVAGAVQQAGSPEAVVGKAMKAVNHGRVDEFVSAMDPDSLEEFRTAIVASIDDGRQASR